jgi:hypothetical protein
MRKHPLDAVSAHAIMTVAHALRNDDSFGSGHEPGIDQQEIVAAGTGFDERNGTESGDHSRSTLPRGVTLAKMDDAFSWRSNSF